MKQRLLPSYRLCRIGCRAAGFTLVEMAIVVSIMAVLMTLGISTAMSVMQASQRTTTQERQTFLRDAFISYFATNHRLPCPDNGSNVGNTGRDGVEDTVGGGAPVTTNNCTTSLGTVPYLTLGISRGQALDAYGNYITYRLDMARFWHLSSTFPANPPAPAPPAVCNPAGILAAPLAGLSVFKPSAAVVDTNVAALVLISHGSNGLGAWNQGPINTSRNALPVTVAEQGNTVITPAGPAGYRDYTYSDVAATPFDDIVTHMTASYLSTVMTTKMGRTNICN
jgi:prepilin-type N-terminal cleavage/methylation domain-containing protein